MKDKDKNKRGVVRVEKVNALAEFDRFKIPFQPAGENEIKMKCPNPEHVSDGLNVTYNTAQNIWKCQSASCMMKGDVVGFIALYTKTARDVVILDLCKRYPLLSKKTINPETIEAFHKQIWTSGPLLKALQERGITDDMIRKARLGYHNGRITIPIYDRDGSIIECRRYLPGAPGPEKMRNTPGYGGEFLYQIEQLKYPIIWVLGGEMKALVAGALLNKHGIGCVSATAGEGNWNADWGPLFKAKQVYFCYDIDKGGLAGSRGAAIHIYNFAQAVWMVRLPLDKEKYPKGDINDYVGKEKAKDDDLIELMKVATQWHPPSVEIEDDKSPPLLVSLADSTNSENVGKKISVKSIITSMDTQPYLIPKDVHVKCSKDQPNCAICPMRPVEPDPETGMMKAMVRSISPGILEMVNSPISKQHAPLREALCIPACKVVEFDTKTHWNVTDVRLAPQLSVGQESSKNVVQPALIVGKNAIEMNVPYVFEGKVYPHPRNQQAILLLDKIEIGEDSLTAFKPTAEELGQLRIFQPTDWSLKALEAKITDIYEDFETNITRIFFRHDLHLAVDLCFHSCLNFIFDGQEKTGWVNTLVTGDTSQGKSETGIRLMEHYALGERTDCKNATVAGLLGGLHQVGTRWFVSWGVIPTNDSRLVMLEEIKGTDPEVIAKLTDMRSSGIAEIPKIEKRRALARTRILMITNPRGNLPVSSHNFGIEVIQKLIPGLEDIRRFDMAMIISSSHVDPMEINKLQINRPKREHKYFNKLCQRLILKIWTTKKEKIDFEDAAVVRILEASTYLSKTYTENIPLVDRGTMRYKLARLSIALAARTYSYLEDNETLMVRDCHVQYVCQFINRVYSDPVFGYKDFSTAQDHANKVVDPAMVRKHILGTKFPRDFVENLLYREEITVNDICDWCDVERDIGQQTLSFFVRKHALFRERRYYVKTSEFITLLKEMKSVKGGIPQAPQIDGKEQF